LRKRLRGFVVERINVYNVMVVNWRKLEERAAWGVLARA
jgi:hypothetical protein